MNEEIAADLFGDAYEEDKVNMMLMIKEHIQCLRKCFAKVVREMPRHYRLKQRMSELNRLWNFTQTPDGSGVQQSLEDRHIKSTPDDADFKQTKKVRVN